MLLSFGLCADIDGQGVMRLISGIIAVEEKDRAARVGKVMKYVSIYNHFSPPWQDSIHIELLMKLSIVSSFPLTFWFSTLPTEMTTSMRSLSR